MSKDWSGINDRNVARQPAAIDKDAFAEYRRGVKEAFRVANMINANRQGRTSEETCSYLVSSLATLANGGEAPAAIGKQCTCKGVLGHSRQCAMFDESMMSIAAPLANEASKPAPSVEQDERGELLPCPFCGDKAEYKYNAFHGDNSLAVCRCCGAQAFWSKWQARSASTSANVAQGWTLVPIEPTDAMVDAACPPGETVDHFDMKTALRASHAAAPIAPSANVAQGDNAALIHAFDSALSGVPRYVIDRFGVEHTADKGGWIKESDLFDRFAASTSTNTSEGFALVPAKMTAKMINAWSGGYSVSSDEVAYRTPFQEAWKRVLAAASSQSANVAQRDALSAVASDIASMSADELRTEHEAHRNGDIAVAFRELSSNVANGEKLTVWYGSMPESNGKTNWTAILHRGDVTSGITIDMSEYPDRVRYEADRMRWMIGELDKEPFILDYDADKHSGYVANAGPNEGYENWFHDAISTGKVSAGHDDQFQLCWAAALDYAKSLR